MTAAAAPASEAPARTSPSAADKRRKIDEAKQDPLVQKALKIFDGQILDVKD
jgi:hypothetical protein